MSHVEKMQHVSTIRPGEAPAPLGKPGREGYIRVVSGDESVRRFGGMAAMAGAALVAAGLLLSPAAAQTDRAKGQRAAASLRGGAVGSFTPAVADPRLAGALARRGNATPQLRFTPVTASVDRRQPTDAPRL